MPESKIAKHLESGYELTFGGLEYNRMMEIEKLRTSTIKMFLDGLCYDLRSAWKDFGLKLAEDSACIDVWGIDTDSGFAHIVVSMPDDPDGLTIQACLKEREFSSDKDRYQWLHSGKPLHTKTIDIDSMTWGICGDVNEAIFSLYPKDSVIEYFKREMRALGVKDFS